MSKIFEVIVVTEESSDHYELAPFKVNLDDVVCINDWSGEMDEGLESYGIDYCGSVTEIVLSDGRRLLATCTFQSICKAIETECSGLKSALVLYISKKKQDEHVEAGEEDEYNDYEVGRRDGVITTLNDVEQILKKF